MLWGAMNRHCTPGLTMSIALTGNSLRECPGIIKTMHTGFSVHVLHYANAPAIRKKLDVILIHGDLKVFFAECLVNR